MAEKYVTQVSAASGIVTLTIATGHDQEAGNYISVRNVNSSVNGQYYILSTPSATELTYDIDNPSYNLSPAATGLDAKILYTSFNESGKPAYIYDESADTWFQISGKVNTNGNYTWTGTHLFQAPVTIDDVVVLKNTSGSAVVTTGGGCLYVENGALKFKGGNGTITNIAPA
jgi:hypothetical protein